MGLFTLPPELKNSASDRDAQLFKFDNPSVDVYRLKRCLMAEWEHQGGVQLTWPHAETDWAYMLEEIIACYVRLAFEIAIREPLLIVAPNVDEVRTLLEQQLPKRATQHIRYFQCPTNDTWARDHGFLCVRDGVKMELMDFRFNGWGGKFAAEKDNAINAQLFKEDVLQGHYVDNLDFELEGGSVESDGAGTILTTAVCLLNKNRNGGPAKGDVEAELAKRLGAEQVLWLHNGELAGDDTDGHIDTLARLCPNNQIAYVQCSDKEDEHYASLSAMEAELRQFRTLTGEPYTLVPLPLPLPIFDEEGERLPATYANFLIMNKAVLLPIYNQPQQDAQAHEALAKIFPQHEIVDIDCSALVRQHGSLHCATMQFPKGVLK